MESISDIIITEEMEKVLRRQKHDFINHIQVIHAYLQIGKPQKALAYLDDLTKKINEGTFGAEYQCNNVIKVLEKNG